MTEQRSPTETEAGATAFVEHVRAFHAGLPAEEQVLLEAMVALAELAMASDADTKGHLQLENVQVTTYTSVSPTLQGALQLNRLGKNQSGRGEPSAGWDLTQQRSV